MKSAIKSPKPVQKKTHSSLHLRKELTAATKVAKSGKRKFRAELDKSCSTKPMKDTKRVKLCGSHLLEQGWKPHLGQETATRGWKTCH